MNKFFQPLFKIQYSTQPRNSICKHFHLLRIEVNRTTATSQLTALIFQIPLLLHLPAYENLIEPSFHSEFSTLIKYSCKRSECTLGVPGLLFTLYVVHCIIAVTSPSAKQRLKHALDGFFKSCTRNALIVNGFKPCFVFKLAEKERKGTNVQPESFFYNPRQKVAWTDRQTKLVKLQPAFKRNLV